MYQTFDVRTDPASAAPRVAALRDAMTDLGISAFLIPRADAHQGENVAPCDERLAWVTSFTGSAGIAAVSPGHAALFVDGRYTLQAAAQTDAAIFTVEPAGGAELARWLCAVLQPGARVGFDPWLHTRSEIDALQERVTKAELTLVPVNNPVDAAWADRPAEPQGPLTKHPEDLAGEPSGEKRARIAAATADRGSGASIITLPDAIAWLLNIRGADIARTPVALGFAILHADATVDLFGMEEKADAEIRAALGPEVAFHPKDAFLGAVGRLEGTVTLDRGTAPIAVVDALADGVTPDWHDPIALPKARKNATELAGARAAHRRDGAAMAEFLAWLDREAPNGELTEIAVARKLEGFRRATNRLEDISFETISGAGPNGAIVHYRVDTNTDRAVTPGELVLVDSGGQYRDGTTDITRTVAIGAPDAEAMRAFTLVLKGLIALTRARFPAGVTGGDLDAIARGPLWRAGLDYAHGTGHGVGAFLGVHEGPQRISRTSRVPLEAGMILSIEPGVYKTGAFGIRIENLAAVTPAETPDGGEQPMHGFETLTLAPIDRRLIIVNLLAEDERRWLDAYHARVLSELSPLVADETRDWLETVCTPL